ASQNRVNVLIEGETGTGKEAVARAIHNVGASADKPFIAINCTSPVETFLESELFGHENGVFSGAEGKRDGKISLALDGTLYLGEVDALSPHLQGKLLRLLEDNNYTPVGATLPQRATCRFIVASDVDLGREVAAKRFREDLYYRLGVFSISIPPLRERSEDIPMLVERLVNKISKEACKTIRRIPSESMDILVKYDWPGNVRQLENVLMKATVIAPGDALNANLLPEEIICGKKPSLSSVDKSPGKTLKELERDHIHSVLVATSWHKGKACDILGISRPRLDRRIDEFGFTRNE
ncbi:MAG: sigma-54-dependent Fis family transcriptional regulator, partial [Rhodospirillaceae bacterium]|nr:sigma-54-dependent Fis family transcriptional regulator [Rhodospirillaceae bacterium]